MQKQPHVILLVTFLVAVSATYSSYERDSADSTTVDPTSYFDEAAKGEGEDKAKRWEEWKHNWAKSNWKKKHHDWDKLLTQLRKEAEALEAAAEEDGVAIEIVPDMSLYRQRNYEAYRRQHELYGDEDERGFGEQKVRRRNYLHKRHYNEDAEGATGGGEQRQSRLGDDDQAEDRPRTRSRRHRHRRHRARDDDY